MASIGEAHYVQCSSCRRRVSHTVVAMVLKDWQHGSHTIARYCGVCGQRVLTFAATLVPELPE